VESLKKQKDGPASVEADHMESLSEKHGVLERK